jgi:osmotically-inducible protein OsmY
MTEPHEARPQTHGALGHLSADEDLQQRVCGALIDSAELDSSGIAVRVASGTVTLSGWVRSQGERQIALSLTRRESGVRAVVARQLEVRIA